MNTQSDRLYTAEEFAGFPKRAQDIILVLEQRVEDLMQRVLLLESIVVELQHQLAKNSSNSSKPPSSDTFKKPDRTRSQRQPSDKKPGGQLQHKGKTLERSLHPDIIKIHTPASCTHCGQDLSQEPGIVVESRQIFDLPKPEVFVIEHRVESKLCPSCQTTSRGTFPEGVDANVQYGPRIQALIVYLKNQQYIPFERACELFEDIFGVHLSAGTCSNAEEDLYHKLAAFEAGLKTHLIAQRILHCDETGMQCEKKIHWIHVIASKIGDLFHIERKRGKDGMDVAGILQNFRNTMVHDHLPAYFQYTEASHSLCNAHHLRELDYIAEVEKEDWAREMKELQLRMLKANEQHHAEGVVPEEMRKALEKEYDDILAKGLSYHRILPPLPRKSRGKQKQRPGKNLLDRFLHDKDAVLLFLRNLEVPFTNNLAENALRMVKLKQKISGCFRVLFGGQIFCRIRSYIATCRKQGWRIWDALAEAIEGHPRCLPPLPP